MRFISVSVLIFGAALCAQPPAPPAAPGPELPPGTVIASFDGTKLTYGELKRFMSMLQPAQQQAAMRDPKGFVREYFMLQHVAGMAEKEKLDQQSPLKDQLEFNRRYLLFQGKLSSDEQYEGR